MDKPSGEEFALLAESRSSRKVLSAIGAEFPWGSRRRLQPRMKIMTSPNGSFAATVPASVWWMREAFVKCAVSHIRVPRNKQSVDFPPEKFLQGFLGHKSTFHPQRLLVDNHGCKGDLRVFGGSEAYKPVVMTRRVIPA